MMPVNRATSGLDPDEGEMVDELVSMTWFNPATNRRETWQFETEDRATIANTAVTGKGAAYRDASGDIQEEQSTSQNGGATADTALDRNCAANPGVHSRVNADFGKEDEVVAVYSPDPSTNRLVGRGAADPDASDDIQEGQSPSQNGGAAAVDRNCAANPGAQSRVGTRQGQSTPQDGRTSVETAVDGHGAASPSGLRIPHGISALFSKPPLLASEDRDQCDLVMKLIVDEVRPTSLIEWFLIKDYVDLTFEIMRLRRAKVGKIDAARREAVREILKTLDGPRSLVDMSSHLVDDWYHKPGAKAELIEKLQLFGINEDTITASAIALCCSDVECLDRMLVSAERRRNGALQEIGHYREVLADIFRRLPADGRLDTQKVSTIAANEPENGAAGQ